MLRLEMLVMASGICSKTSHDLTWIHRSFRGFSKRHPRRVQTIQRHFKKKYAQSNRTHPWRFSP